MTDRTRPESLTLHLAAAGGDLTADAGDRVIEGLCVPYGPVGNSSLGAITFAAGTLTYAEVGRVKLLKQHDPNVVLGYALELTERPDGLWGRFAVAPGDLGDTALAEVAAGTRDGLSVGVLLDEAVLEQMVEQWIAGDTSPVAASGQLLEVSQVSLPAFDDARIPASPALAAAGLTGHLTLSARFTTPAPVPPAPVTPRKEPSMDPVTEAAAPAPVAPAPAPNPAATSSTVVSSEPAVYTFDGRGPSLIRDAFRLKAEGDTDAAARFARFNAQLRAGEAEQGRLLVAAVETRATAPNFINQGYRPELLVEAIDRGRPMVSRIGTVNLTDATPFRVPVEGDFYKVTTVADAATTSASTTVTSATAAFTAADLGIVVTSANLPAGTTIVKINSATSVEVSQKATATGASQSLSLQRFAVADHTEGQAHATEGDLDVGEVLFTPGAISGAYRLTRELIDATNPALDRIALRAMARNYAGQTEAKVGAALVAAAPTPIAGVNTVLKARQELNTFYDVSGESPRLVFSSVGYYNGLIADVDSTGRPHLATVNPVNAVGGMAPGFTGAYIDSAEIVKAQRVTGGAAYATNPDDVLIGESTVQTFRFEEVEGPGVIKLALWAYFGAKVLRPVSVRAIAL